MNVKRSVVAIGVVALLLSATPFIWWTLKYESLVGDDIRDVVSQMTASGALLIPPDQMEVDRECIGISQVRVVPKQFPSLIIFDLDGCRIKKVRMGWRK